MLRQSERALVNQFGNNAFTVKDLDSRLTNLDLGRIADFNFSTYFPNGYWEYMNHNLTFDDPESLPKVKHTADFRIKGPSSSHFMA